MLRISPPKLSMLIANISVRTETRLPLEGNCSIGAASCVADADAVDDGAGTALALMPSAFPIGVTVGGVPAAIAGGRLCFCHASHKKRPDAEKTTIAIILCVSMLSRERVKLKGPNLIGGLFRERGRGHRRTTDDSAAVSGSTRYCL